MYIIHVTYLYRFYIFCLNKGKGLKRRRETEIDLVEVVKEDPPGSKLPPIHDVLSIYFYLLKEKKKKKSMKRQKRQLKACFGTKQGFPFKIKER